MTASIKTFATLSSLLVSNFHTQSPSLSSSDLEIDSKDFIHTTIPANVDTNAFFFWYNLPDNVRSSFLSPFKKENTSIYAKNTDESDSLPIIRNTTIPADVFTKSILQDKNWIENNSKCFDEKMGICNFKSQCRLFMEALKFAPADEIEELILSAPIMVQNILNKLPQSLTIFCLTNSVKSGKSIFRLLKIFEIISNFDLSKSPLILNIRKEAFRRDDPELMKLTDEYPERLDPSLSDYSNFLSSLDTVNGSPEYFWEKICQEPAKEGNIYMVNSSVGRKFKIFSEPVNTDNWTLLMFALASGKYDLARKIAVETSYRPDDNPEKNMNKFVDGNPIRKLEHLLPFIPEPSIVEFIIDKYNLHKDLVKPTDPLFPSFRTVFNENKIELNKSNERNVQVLREHEYDYNHYKNDMEWKVINADEETDKIFSLDWINIDSNINIP